MSRLKKILFIKILILFIILILFVAGAIPRYINMNKHAEASECRRNQMIVETALAIAYAESLSIGSSNFPKMLEPNMFEDGKIPTCPIENMPIKFDKKTGAAFCPHHILSHERIY